MSDAHVQVFTPDGELIGYSVYAGSSSILWPGLSREFTWEPEGAWRRCPHPVEDGEPVLIYSDYGRGSHWSGLACLECRVLHGPLSDGYIEISYYEGIYDPGPVDCTDGHPFPNLHDCTLVAK